MAIRLMLIRRSVGETFRRNHSRNSKLFDQAIDQMAMVNRGSYELHWPVTPLLGATVPTQNGVQESLLIFMCMYDGQTAG